MSGNAGGHSGGSGGEGAKLIDTALGSLFLPLEILSDAVDAVNPLHSGKGASRSSSHGGGHGGGH